MNCSDGKSRSFHARIPERVAFDFKIRPKSSVNVEEAKSSGLSKQKKFDKLLQKVRSGGPKSSR